MSIKLKIIYFYLNTLGHIEPIAHHTVQMLKEIHGDITKLDVDIIIQQCDCISGVAVGLNAFISRELGVNMYRIRNIKTGISKSKRPRKHGRQTQQLCNPVLQRAQDRPGTITKTKIYKPVPLNDPLLLNDPDDITETSSYSLYNVDKDTSYSLHEDVSKDTSYSLHEDVSKGASHTSYDDVSKDTSYILHDDVTEDHSCTLQETPVCVDSSKGPLYVVSMFAQFAPGLPGKQFKKITKAHNYWDNREERLYWFEICLYKLKEFAVSIKAKTIAIPKFIGCDPDTGGNVRDYHGAIQKFVNILTKDITVYIVSCN